MKKLLAYLIVGVVAGFGACAGVQKIVDSCAGAAKGAVDSLTQQAYESATNQTGAPSWTAFASTTLLAQGEAIAICAAQGAIAMIDGKLPASPAAPGGHDHIVANVAIQADPLLASGHERLADFLDTHGSSHSHIVPESR